MRGLAVAGTIAAASALAAWAVRGRSSPVFGPSIYRGSAARRSLALTFDDGPSEATPGLLRILDEFGAAATFFVCGRNVERLPGVAREVAARGHEIGNHSWSHARFWLRSPAFIAQELARAQSAIRETTGRTPTLFRAPFGARWFGLRHAQRQMNLLGVMWTVVGLDWKLPAERIARRVLAAASNGAIVCLHDGRGLEPNPDIHETLAAVSRLLPELRGRGFAFETVSQLLCPNH
ncbi:MAG: polysaccharide deacetylase family protein [Candidatus Solibacter usitatus]|nr:polysaccharide deacetylase family protein [Candidatus Solibacter usitatus]